MTLEELLEFCEKNGVAINIRYDGYCDSARIRLQTNDNYQCELLVQKECREEAPDKKEHFQFVLDYLINKINKYKVEPQESRE